ncbi:MAG: HTTM domain-containing protein [Myxococcota bacterium]
MSVTRLYEGAGHIRPVALFRLAAGPIFFVHLWPFWQRLASGEYFVDRFHVPLFIGMPTLDEPTYRTLLALALVSAFTLSIGLLSRLSAAYACSCVAFHIASNQLFFHHNRAFLMTLLFALALLPAGRDLSVDAWLARTRGRPLSPSYATWRLLLVRLLACTPYLASGTSKLIDPDWWGGVVMTDRIHRYRGAAEARGVPIELLDFLESPAFAAVWWKFIVLTELFIGVGLWSKRTRLGAIFMALCFHAFIELTSTVSVFSYLGVCATLLWVTPHVQDRTLVLPRSARFQRRARWLRRLDWLARFRIAFEDRAAPCLIDRNGERLEGRSARWTVLSRLPLVAPIAIPLLALVRPNRGATR